MIMKIVEPVVMVMGKLNWEGVKELFTGRRYNLTIYDRLKIMRVLAEGNYFILTRRHTHLSTYMANAAHWLLTGRWGYWSHFTMNVDLNPTADKDKMRFIEAIGKGVTISSFDEIFNCDGVWIGKPILPDGISWEEIMEAELKNEGKKYDTFGKINDPTKMNCVEVGLDAIKKVPDYEQRFHGLLAMIKLEKNLSPDMFIESGSFVTVLEIKR